MAKATIGGAKSASKDEALYVFSEDNSLGVLPEKIFLDRYALKDGTKESLKVGDTIVVCTDTKSGRREIGVVKSLVGQDTVLELRDGTIIERLLEHVDKPLETTYTDLAARMAKGIASVEKTEEGKKLWENNFRWLLDGFKFLPAGRILATAGTDQNLTCYNCYVIPSPHDSRGGILSTLGQMNEIFSRGGGVGINLSSLRPRYSYVKGVNGRSSGAVSWGGLYSFSTGLIEQGGSRRGALMLILNCWHPDVIEFINSKRVAGQITNANISVGFTDDFMDAVKANKSWDLIFPDTTDPEYDAFWDGNLDKWRAAGKKINVYKTVQARELWNSVIDSAWASAEPGVFFMERYNKMSNSWYFAPILCTNPCGEQGLPGWGVCNLGAINLAKFVDFEARDVEWEKLRQAVGYAVRFLDNVIDWTPYFFEENERQQKGERRVGLNTMGLAEMMIHLGIRYGSEESTAFIDRLYRFICHTAYQTSAELAEEKGAFPFFESEKFLESGFMKSLPKETRKIVEEKGIRNVTLLTQAPNGTIGTMAETSTGIEPFYSWTYFRTSRLGTHEENVKIVTDWKKANPGKELPDYFVTAMDLSPIEHVNVQAAIQRWIDSSISKTCNVPTDYTVEQTRELYELMYDLGCKGGTIYRDKSRDVQILNLESDEARDKAKAESLMGLELSKESLTVTSSTTSFSSTEGAQSIKSVQDAQEEFRIKPRPRPSVVHGTTEEIRTGMGKMFVTINEDDHGPFELFANIGKSGSETTSLTEAIGRLISLSLRSGIEVNAIIKNLKGIRGSAPVWENGELILSVPDALAKSMSRYIDRKNSLGFISEEALQPDESEHKKESAQLVSLPMNSGEKQAEEPEIFMSVEDHSMNEAEASLCPECGMRMYRSEGCMKCDCGFSMCG